MSELATKLEQPHTSAGRARRTLRTLTGQRGYVVLSRNQHGEVDWVKCEAIDGPWYWRRVQSGADGLFELEERT